MIPANWQELVIAEARTWQNTPYVPKGRVKGVGVDCGGLLYQVYNPIFGPFAPYPSDYSPDWSAHEVNERYLSFILPISEEVKEVQPGGFSLFHVGLNYSHAAIYLGENKYIHAWGRQREGRVTITPVRVMFYLAKQDQEHPVRHFTPRG